jgi:cytochrome P450
MTLIETTSTTLTWAVLFLSLNPAVQSECQEEIDSILGSRMPTQDDAASMPYVSATILEIQRLSCTAFLSVSHRTTKDTEYEDRGRKYVIPKDSLVVSNLRRFLMDCKVFPHPDEFRNEEIQFKLVYQDSSGLISLKHCLLMLESNI